MTWTCGVASDRSSNWATTTARQMCFSCWPVPVSSSCYTHTSIGARQYCHQFLEGNMLFFWTQNSFVTFFHFRIHFLLRFLPIFISGGVKVCPDILSQSCTRIFLALNSYEEIYHHCCCWCLFNDISLLAFFVNLVGSTTLLTSWAEI